MFKSTIDSIVKLPLQIPIETGGGSKREAEPRSLAIRAEPAKKGLEKDSKESKKEEPLHSNGYIKCPAYDFF